MAIIITPPAPLEGARGRRSVFLAGSIEMGAAEDWQQRVIAALADLDLAVLNPRRSDWDSSWTQRVEDPRFREQVEWELAALEQADRVVMYFAPGTQAPITLLELGLFARSGKLWVCCPEPYWRKGNVDVVCARYGVPTVPTLADLITAARRGASI